LNDTNNIWRVFKNGMILGGFLMSLAFFVSVASAPHLPWLGYAVLFLPDQFSSVAVPQSPGDPWTVSVVMVSIFTGFFVNALVLATPYYVWRLLRKAPIENRKSKIENPKWA
jgi:hypothetical protein